MGPRKIVLLGMMTKMPVAGVVWQNVHYLIGLERLGYEAYYVEAHARTPSMLMEHEKDDSSVRAAAFIEKVMARFALRGRWAFHALHADGRCYGLSEAELRRLYESAELIVNLHGATLPLPEHSATGRLVYLETDPVQVQIELHDERPEAIEFLEQHSAFFTFAENYGREGCLLPVSDRFDFRPTRQPVVLDFWAEHGLPAGERFTTIANWHQPWRDVQLDGGRYSWSKRDEFLRFLDLPAHVPRELELALSGCEPSDKRLLKRHRWKVRDALGFSLELDSYRDYIAGSRGELTVGKDQNVRFRSGWFSDRSATYLACGRPVITQDTGFGSALPVGEGLFAFSTVEEAQAAAEQVESDYERHARAASEIAREHFAAEVVLGRLLSDLGLPVPPRGSRARMGPAASTVSVVIPCFNLGEFLPEAVASARAQTRPPLEIIVVDDGSTDPQTLAALEECRQLGVVVYRTENRGASAARNYGIERSSGEYVVCLDADDVLLPTFLEQTVPALDASPAVGVVTTHVEFFGEVEGLWRPPDFDPVALLWRNCVASASLFRRQCWSEAGGYADLDGCQDWSFWISLVERGWTWAVVPETLYRYRRRRGSISEHRETNRPEILRKLVSLHEEVYRERAADVFVAMDAELQRTNKTLTQARDDNRKLKVKVASLTNEVEALAGRSEASGAEVPEQTLAALPPHSTVIVVGEGKVGGLEGHQVLHLPESADSAQAILALEELQAEGGEFLLVPSASLGWLRRHAWFHRHLERRYTRVGTGGELLLFDVTSYHSFSVVICTYRRAPLVEKAIRSVLAQNYPTDRFEVIVVDNDSRDGTEEVVRRVAAGSPVPLSYHVEERNGLSFCRNLGAAVGRNEFIAYLDDDATACADWLRSFNAVINQHHALVVGGRVEKTFEDDFEVPDWFGYQYMKSFFGVNYREWGKTDRVFRITHPRYIGGGNSAYARRLFDRFGSFHTALGRNEKTLLAAEESYLNLRLDRAGVPIYYTDDAVIHHFIDSGRLTRRHVLRKAAWSGVSNALMYTMLFGYREALRRTRTSLVEMRRLGFRVLRSRRDPENFSRVCRIVYHLGFFAKLTDLGVRRAFGRAPRTESRAGSWGPADYLAEVETWPESTAKYHQLHELHHAQGDEQRADEALERLAERLLRLDVPVTAAAGLDGLWGPLRQLGYRRLLDRIGDTVDANLPKDATLIVVSRGDDELLAACRREAAHFPQVDGGVYAGHYPATDDDAVAHVEQLRIRGGEYLVFPSTGLWWLEHYSGLRKHLESRYPVVVSDDETCLIFSLNGVGEHKEASVPAGAGWEVSS